jgi:hypothetical protein
MRNPVVTQFTFAGRDVRCPHPEQQAAEDFARHVLDTWKTVQEVKLFEVSGYVSGPGARLVGSSTETLVHTVQRE